MPPRPTGLIDEAFAELARRWRPKLNAYDDAGVDIGFELHPGQDTRDGTTFEIFLDAVGAHPRARINYDPSHFVLQQLEYLAFIDIYHERICAFHAKDAEFHPNGRQGVYGGYQPWVNRAGRFRRLGDGHVDFVAVFSKLAEHRYEGWAVLEWECFLKSPAQGPAEGAPFIARHIIQTQDRATDTTNSDPARNARMLGLDRERR